MKTSDWENVSKFIAEHSDASMLMSVQEDEGFMRAAVDGDEDQLTFIAAFLVMTLARGSEKGKDEWFDFFSMMLANVEEFMEAAEASKESEHSGEQTKMDPKMFFPG